MPNERIDAINATGRALAEAINEAIINEDLRGSSPAVIRRTEEIVEEVVSDDDRGDWEFGIMRPGVTVHPLVTITRFLGKVGR